MQGLSGFEFYLDVFSSERSVDWHKETIKSELIPNFSETYADGLVYRLDFHIF